VKGATKRPRTLKADKPCKMCGKPVHYTYQGPVEGVCGRCTDKRRARRRNVRPYHRGMVVERRPGRRRSTAATVLLIALVMVGGAVAVAAALGFVLG